MATHPCATCGRQINPSIRCPHCGTENSLEEELARIDRSIAEMSARDMAILKERSQLSSKMQAALFQRDILAHAHHERQQRGARPSRVRRRPARPAAAPVRPPWTPPQGGTVLVDEPPADVPPPRRARTGPPPPDGAGPPAAGADDSPAVQAEASSRSVQNILLALGGLLLGVAAVVFAGVALSSFDAVGRAGVLAAGSALALTVAPAVARRRLTATAETIAAVGLVFVPLALYALHGVTALGGDRVSEQVFLGAAFAATAVVALLYAGATRLGSPRYATVLALQPVLPLLAYEQLQGPTGWALVLTVVASLDVLLLLTAARRGPLVPPRPAGRPTAVDVEPEPTTPVAEPDRPETRPEEPDLVIPLDSVSAPPPRQRRPPRFFPGPRPAGTTPAGVSGATAPAPVPPSATWLRELMFALVTVGVAGGLAYATVALLDAAAPGAAVRAAAVLLLAAGIGVLAARISGNDTARQLAGGALTLAVLGAAARVTDVAAPGQALVSTAAVIALTGVVVRLLPDTWRRGPQWASAVAVTVLGIVVAGDVLRAAVAPVRAAAPAWQADVDAYAGQVYPAAGPAGWQLAVAAFFLTVAAALALPAMLRHEASVAGLVLSALAVPASFHLPWSQAPWPLVVTAILLGAGGLAARTRRVAVTHIAGAGVLGLFGAAIAAAQPWLTAAALTALAGAGLLVAVAARQLRTNLYAWQVGDWAAGGAAFALPGAVAAATVSANDPQGVGAATVPALAASFVAVAVTLSVAAVIQVARREISTPLTLGTGLGALAVTLAAFRADGSTAPDIWVGALLMAAAVLLFLAPSIDAGRRADRWLDGPDIAAAAATVAVIGALARVAALAFPTAELAATAAVVLLVALGIRAMPADWRRGPTLGTAVGGAVILLIAGYTALSGGLRVLAAPGPIWRSDLAAWPAQAADGAWQAPVALVLLAVAATAALPRPAGYDVAAVCAGLATIGTPAALGLPWWSPLVVGGAVMIGYGVYSVAAHDPRAALARAGVAAGVGLHTAGASLVRPWTTAAALALIVGVGIVVAGLARAVAPGIRAEQPVETDDGVVDLAVDDTGLPRHLGQIGGAATAGALLAFPGVLAALAAQAGRPADVLLTAALAGSSISLALLTTIGRRLPQYLPYATVGIVGGATATAVASLPTEHPTALYAAAAALLGVLAELLRGATTAPGLTVPPVRHWTASGRLRRVAVRPPGLRGRWSVDPATGALAVAALPAALALATIAPLLVASLVDPYQTLGQIWQGPPVELTDPVPGRQADGTSVLAALLLTLAAALAAIGFSDGRPARSVPVILPGLAITLLITPIAVDLRWPAVTMAALVVFTISMLGLALTPPPVAERATLLRITRNVVFGIGLAAGGAGLAGSLATEQLTLFTLGSAVGVGATAALAGRSQAARILGWLFAATFGQLFALTATLSAGLDPTWAAFGVLAVGAAMLIVEATLPRLRLPESAREASAVEWSGYAAALLAVALAYDSPRHLAALLAAWGAVLGIAGTRPGRPANERRILFWLAVGFEVGAWWLLMRIADVALPEAYTLPFAALALLVGVLEIRHRPDLSSWAAYGPALLAAFVPTVVIVLSTDTSDAREVLLLLGSVATLIVGSRWRQQAPVVVGAVVAAISALHFTVTLVGPWLVLIPVGLVLLALGASNENRRRTQERLRGALTGLR